MRSVAEEFLNHIFASITVVGHCKFYEKYWDLHTIHRVHRIVERSGYRRLSGDGADSDAVSGGIVVAVAQPDAFQDRGCDAN